MLRPYLFLAAVAYFVFSLISFPTFAEDEIIADFPEPIVKERPKPHKVKPMKEMFAKGQPAQVPKGKSEELKDSK